MQWAGHMVSPGLAAPAGPPVSGSHPHEQQVPVPGSPVDGPLRLWERIKDLRVLLSKFYQ